MIDSFTVEHYEHVSHRSFEDVVAAFEAELGSVEDGAIPREVAAALDRLGRDTRDVLNIVHERCGRWLLQC